MIQRLKTIAHRLHQRYLLWELGQVNAALAAIPDNKEVAIIVAQHVIDLHNSYHQRRREAEQRRAIIIRQIAGV
jgi:hypothetical protein